MNVFTVLFVMGLLTGVGFLMHEAQVTENRAEEYAEKIGCTYAGHPRDTRLYLYDCGNGEIKGYTNWKLENGKN